MGVIYKFKKEVIDFVLQQKRESQGLSCRQLAVLTSEKFKLQVSKSSVNAIIKNAHLSSGVGRRLGFDPAPRKFEIPSRKKKQLSDEMRKVGLEKKKPPVASVPSRRPEVPPEGHRSPPGESLSAVRGEPASGEARRESRRPTGRPQRGASAVVSIPDAPASAASRIIAQDFSGWVERLRQERICQKGPVREWMGCVFLMAAQWELSRASVLGKLLRKYVLPVCRQAGQQLPDIFDAACDMLPCLSALGVNPIEQIGQLPNHALWTFFPHSVSSGDVLGAFHGLNCILPSRRLLFEYEEEKKQILVEAGGFRVLLEDGSEIMMDARLTGVWSQKAPPQLSAPLEQAMVALSHCVVSNNRPAVFLSSGTEQFHHGVWEMIAAWEGLANKRLEKLDVLSPSGELLATFSSFPDKKRVFMLGVWPWQREFTSFLKDAGALEPFYCEDLDRVVYARDWLIHSSSLSGLSQGQLKEAGPFRAIAVSMSSPAAAEAVIFTNWVQGAAKDAAGAFLRRWPYLNKGPAGLVLPDRALSCLPDRQAQPGGPRDMLAPPEPESLASKWEQTDLSVLSRDLGEVLHRYCQKRFLKGFSAKDDITASGSIYYGISGSCLSGKERVEIFLNPPAGYERLDELRLAAQRLNESVVTDPWNRRLFVTVE